MSTNLPWQNAASITIVKKEDKLRDRSLNTKIRTYTKFAPNKDLTINCQLEKQTNYLTPLG